MKLGAILFYLLMGASAHSVELLVQAKDFWQVEQAIPEGTAEDTTEYLREFWYNTHLGAVIVVKPDGWVWGKQEMAPEFVIIKIPGMPMAQARRYIEGLTGHKERQWFFLPAFIDSALTLWIAEKSLISLSSVAFLARINAYDSTFIQSKIQDRKRR